MASEVMEVFDRHAEEFDDWFTHNKAIYLSELNALKVSKPKGRILNLGVGSGIFASELGVSLGIDISWSMLQRSRARGLEVIQADMKRLPLAPNTFDAVVSSFTVCFVDDAHAMISEAARVLRRNGKLIVGEVTSESEWGKLYESEGRQGHRFYSKANFVSFDETSGLICKAGLKIQQVIATLSSKPQGVVRPEEPVVFRRGMKVAQYGFIVITAAKR